MKDLLPHLSFAWFFSFVVTMYLVPIFCLLAKRMQFLDVPGGIKNHKEPTPYLGGVAVYCGFLCSLALTAPFDNTLSLFLVGSTLLLFVGLIDDLIALTPYQKFCGQLIATICFVKGGFYLKNHLLDHWWNIPLSALWIATIINAFNLVDVMDGLATTIAIAVACNLFMIAWTLGQPDVAIILMSFIGALCGFLWYNKPVARMYLGDAGSLFVGSFLASIPFLLKWGTYSVHGYLAPVIILAIPLLELVTLIIIRTYKGIPFYNGSPDHFCLYLRNNGWRIESILLYTVMLSIILGAVSYCVVTNVMNIYHTFLVGISFLIIWTSIFWWK